MRKMTVKKLPIICSLCINEEIKKKESVKLKFNALVFLVTVAYILIFVWSNGLWCTFITC